MQSFSRSEMISRLQAILEAHHFSTQNALSLAKQLVEAEAMGQSTVGIAHALDFIGGVQRGQIDTLAEPVIAQPAPTVIAVDGQGGIPQRGFDAAFELICETTRRLGMAMFLHRNATLCGALGTYAARLADAGFFCIAATNGPALMRGSGGNKPVFSTNPMAFAAPGVDGPEVMVDQSSSATAFVNLRQAAQDGTKIPFDWAVDKEGQPTSDPAAAMAGMLLPFGGARGANMALLVELLAAGLTGGNWSIDAPSFGTGAHSPATGLFILVIAPDQIDPRLRPRMTEHLNRLSETCGLYLPGRSKIAASRDPETKLTIDPDLLKQLERA